MVDPNKHFAVISRNSFPTGSGLASSSSGIAALIYCLKDLYPEINVGLLCRIGSGSAARASLGHLVKLPGVSLDNLDNHQTDVISQESLRCLPIQMDNCKWLSEITQIAILQDPHTGPKQVLSSEGMRRTWATSAFLRDRVRNHVNDHINQFEKALKDRDFDKLMEVIMRDSNQFHATALDTYPPLLYLSDFSRQIIFLIHEFNRSAKNHVGYTFDAGAHAVILMHKNEKQKFTEFLQAHNGTHVLNSEFVLPDILFTEIGNGPKRV